MWVNLRPGWRNDLSLTTQALGLRWRNIHIVHRPPCPKEWSLVSVAYLTTVLDGCTCATLRFRPLSF